MNRLSTLCGLVSLMSLPVLVVAQVLGGDSRFPVLNEIRWDMSAGEIQGLCKNRWKEASSTDSTIVYTSTIFGVAAKTKIQIDPHSQKPRMIDIGFEQPTNAIRDALVNHFTLTTGMAPLVTTKEKSAIIFTIRLEMAVWKTGKETVGVVTATRGSSIIALSLILSQTSISQKESP